MRPNRSSGNSVGMSWAANKAVVSNDFSFREGEDEYDLKMQFAAIVARDPAQAMMAGYKLFDKGPADYGRAMQAQAWLTDPIVRERIAQLIGTDEVAVLLPSDAEVEKELWDTIRGTQDPSLKIKGIDLMAQIRGMKKTAGDGPGGSLTAYIQNVIKLPNRVEGPDEDALFEARFEAQQLKLVKDARSSKPD